MDMKTKFLANEKKYFKKEIWRLLSKEQPEVHVVGNGVWNDPKYGLRRYQLETPNSFHIS